MSIEDRLEIQDLLARYAAAVDGRDFTALDDVFTADARIDYSAVGGPAGDLPTIRAFLAETLPSFARTQHMMGLPVIDLRGDDATVRTPCHNPMVLDNGDGTRSLWLISIWYDDVCVCTPAGWRIRSRAVDFCAAATGLAYTSLGPA